MSSFTLGNFGTHTQGLRRDEFVILETGTLVHLSLNLGLSDGELSTYQHPTNETGKARNQKIRHSTPITIVFKTTQQCSRFVTTFGGRTVTQCT